MSELKIYKASAGSGKTFTLTREFLFLLYENPLSYTNTLAVTFTNKATGEMKSRILEKLYQLANHQTDDYIAELKNKFELSESQVRQRAQVLLSYLLHDFSSFSVSTIDSFFQKIIRAFAREAGLESGFKIELNTPKILQKAIDHLLMKVDLPEHKQLKNWLVQFAEQKLTQGKNWNLSRDLNSLGSEIFNELFQLESREILETISNKEGMQDYLKNLQAIINDFESKIKAFGEEGSSAIIKSGLKYDLFTGKSRTPVKYFEKLKAVDKLEPGATVLKLIDAPEKWGRKDNPPNVNEQIDQLYPLLNMLLKKAIDLIQREYENYQSAKVISQNYFALGIIADIAKEVQHICREENIFLIADSSHFLNRIIDQNEAPFIYEKIGSRFQNFMIDEFQDTSKLQWLNFRPLVDNSLASNQTSLIVGDVKQSIYRWRNSDWSLLSSKVDHDFKHYGSQQLTLNKNWRSFDNIIKFNNSLFTAGGQLLQNDFNRMFSSFFQTEVANEEFKDKISQAYADVFQEIPEHKLGNKGYINAKFYTKNNDYTYEEWILEDIISQIELLVSNGYQYSDICVLVRKKEEGETIANALLGGTYTAPIPVISNESLFLAGSAAIQFMMAQIKYLQNPYNLVLKAEMVLHFELLKKADENAQLEIGRYFDLNQNDDFSEKDYPWIKELLKLRQKPLLELVEQLAHDLPEHIKEEQGVFIQAFINSTSNFINDHYPDLTAFIEWWEDKGKTEAVAIPDEQNAIKIMTIHKSKGLEFKAVIIPFCNWKLDSEINSNIIWCKPKQAPFNEIKLLPVTYTSRLQNTIFKEDYFEERLYQNVDSLNLLYVALTRSCEVLLSYGNAPSKNNKGELKSVADLMFFAFSHHQLETGNGYINLAESWNAEELSFVYGQIPDNTNITQEKSNTNGIMLKSFQNRLLSNDQIAIKTDSDDYFTSNGTQSKVDFGKLMHEAFAHIISVDDVDKAIHQLVFEGKIEEDKESALKKDINQLISQPETSDWFNSHHKVKTECAILTPLGTYRPDRVVFTDEEIHIIDYKFGTHEEPKYEKQVLQYVNHIKQMEKLKVKGFIWYVSLNKIVDVNTAPPVQGSLF